MTNLRQPTPLALTPSFGFGDRLGLATPGHLEALRKEGGTIAPIFAQQSIREMQRTGRTPTGVMHDAIEALRSEGFFSDTGDAWGADADHLKTTDDVDITADAGFVFFTIDPSDHVDTEADNYDEVVLAKKFAAVESEVDWVGQYLHHTVKIVDGPAIDFNETTVRRAAVKYGRAIAHALSSIVPWGTCQRILPSDISTAASGPHGGATQGISIGDNIVWRRMP